MSDGAGRQDDGGGGETEADEVLDYLKIPSMHQVDRP